MDESCLWERVYAVHSSISETKPKECEMALAQFGVSHSHTIFYFIFTVLLESFSLPGTFEWCKFITRTTFFELKRTHRTNELEYNSAGTERERERKSIMHGNVQYNANAVFYLRLTKHIIRTFYVSYSLNVSGHRNFCRLIS